MRHKETIFIMKSYFFCSLVKFEKMDCVSAILAYQCLLVYAIFQECPSYEYLANHKS